MRVRVLWEKLGFRFGVGVRVWSLGWGLGFGVWVLIWIRGEGWGLEFRE